MKYKCPARESSKFLCDKVAEYQIEGTVWCNTHARRVIDKELAEVASNAGQRYKPDRHGG
jgi:hypothetical protein